MDQVPFHLDACGDLTWFRRALEDKGFTEEALGNLLHPGDSNRPAEVALDRAGAIRRAKGPSPLCVLARLFALAQTVSEAEARQRWLPLSWSNSLRSAWSDAATVRRVSAPISRSCPWTISSWPGISAPR